MVLGARDCVVEQSAQMFKTSGDGMRPEYDNVRKLAVLGALDSHGEMAPVWPETQPRAVADGFMNELPDLPSGKSRLPLHPAQAVHAAKRLRYGSMPGQRHQDHAQIGVIGQFWQRDVGQQGVGFFRIVMVPFMPIRAEDRAVIALILFGLNSVERSADKIARDMQRAGAGLRSIAERVVDTTSDFAELVLAMLGVAAKLERRRITERTARGRADAKAKGVRFGRKPKLTAHQQREARERIEAGETQRSVARSYNVSQATISRL
jgi:hypothetical protein